MIYSNKLYAIPDIAKKLKIKESDIRLLINKGIIPVVNLYNVEFLKGSVALNLMREIKEFNKKKDVIEIKEGDLIN